MLKSQHLRRKGPSGLAGRNTQRRKNEELRSDRLDSLEERMGRILKGVKDVQNLSNSLRAQNEILQESHVELADRMQAYQQLEPTNTQDTDEASSSSGEAETPRQAATSARKTLKEIKAWRERIYRD